MSRAIEFRAWHETQGVMLQVGDNLGTVHPFDCCNYARQGQPVVLLEFTGLTDKNGVKIFEGDICNVREFNSKKWEVCEVIWGCENGWGLRGYYGKKGESDHFGIRFSARPEIEVIGDVYSAPELLEQKP